MKRLEVAILIGVIAAAMLSSFGVFAGESAQLRGQVLRLHVVANSNTPADQALKLQVRDAILSTRPFAQAYTKEQSIAIAIMQLGEIEDVARQAIAGRGYEYTVAAEIVNMHFPARHYEGFMLPGGRYDALRLTIGQGQGENWWCIMFPPMCLPAAQAQPLPIQEQVYRLGQPARYRPKFAVLEFIESLRAPSGCA